MVTAATKAAAQKNKPVIVVVMGGSAVDLSALKVLLAMTIFEILRLLVCVCS